MSAKVRKTLRAREAEKGILLYLVSTVSSYLGLEAVCGRDRDRAQEGERSTRTSCRFLMEQEIVPSGQQRPPEHGQGGEGQGVDRAEGSVQAFC